MARGYPPLRVFLYQGNKGTTLVEELSGRIHGLRFGYQLHGGASACSFTLTAGLDELWGWFGTPNRLFWRIAVREASADGRLVWEGRIEDLELGIGQGGHTLGVTAYGYWRACFDQLYYDVTTFVGVAAGAANADDIINDILSTACPDIDGTGDIDDPGVDLDPWKTEGVNGQYPGDLIVDLAKLSDASGNPWYFWIGDNRAPSFKARSLSTLTWTVDLRDVAELKLMRSAGDFWSRVTAAYIDSTSGVETAGTTQTDAAAETKYLRREYSLSIPGQQVPVGAANNAAVWKKLQSREVQQHASFTITGPVYDSRGLECPPWRVRAGDVLRIRDLVPNSQDLSQTALDALRTFYVIETEYDVDSHALRVLPDRPGLDLPSLLVRGGLGGQE